MTVTQIAEDIKNFVLNLGYIALDIVVSKRKDFYKISFAIFKKNDVTVEDCEKVTLFVKDFLMMMLGEDFSLDVSSPGAERVLKNIEEFDIFAGRKAKVILKSGNVLSGILKGTDENKKVLFLEDYNNGEILPINIYDIAKCKLAL